MGVLLVIDYFALTSISTANARLIVDLVASNEVSAQRYSIMMVQPDLMSCVLSSVMFVPWLLVQKINPLQVAILRHPLI